ncbi:MAG: OmpA family protein, partial [Flavobacteriales bacterium]|nr:OmpA family protein [Flavobacteriales bacterium]
SELLCYEFFEEATLNADSVAMIYEWDFGDGTKERALETYHCYETAGIYIVELNIMDPMIGKTFVNEAIYELEIEEVLQPVIICPDTISMKADFLVKVEQGKWEKFQIGNYYIDYGDSVIIKNEKNTYSYKSDGFKELKILISGYDKSSESIVTKCFYKNVFVTSEVTSLAVQDKFLEELNYEGFNSDKINEHVPGEAYYSLEILNSPSSVLNDTNQLKEFTSRVIEIFDSSSSTYSYVLGKTNNPFDMIDEFRAAHKAGFINAIVKSIKNESFGFEGLGMVYDNESGEVNIVLNNIHFEFNGYQLDEKSKVELGTLIQYLSTNTNVRIEIGAHTDDVGNNRYNLKLSQKRATNVINYISLQGIEMTRLKAKGYGESQPLVPNNLPDGSDHPEGRAKNRRVTFKILSN